MTDSTPALAGAPDFVALAAARRDRLMGGADRLRSPDAWLFARLVAAREVRGELVLLGLTSAQLTQLAARHFAAGETPAPLPPVIVEDRAHADFVAALRGLLIGLAAPGVDREDARCLASIVAHACLRPDHLWRDLGLDGRDDVTGMLARFFPEIVARNVEDLRWKKLLARELACVTGTTPGPAPGCPGCEDFGYCFASAR